MEILAPPPVDPLVRSEPPFVWGRTPEPDPRRTEAASVDPDDTLDPDVALWRVIVVNAWPFAGAPTSGTFPLGWLGVDNTGTPYVCTAAGSPGTWVKVGAGAGGYASLTGAGESSTPGALTQTGPLTVTGTVTFSGLPSADPHVIGELWDNAGVLTVSAG